MRGKREGAKGGERLKETIKSTNGLLVKTFLPKLDRKTYNLN